MNAAASLQAIIENVYDRKANPRRGAPPASSKHGGLPPPVPPGPSPFTRGEASGMLGL